MNSILALILLVLPSVLLAEKKILGHSSIVAVMTPSGGTCTGFFLSAKHLITAGHCTSEGEVRVDRFRSRDFSHINGDGTLVTFFEDVATRLGIKDFFPISIELTRHNEEITFYNYDREARKNRVAWGSSDIFFMEDKTGQLSEPGFSGGPALNAHNEVVGWVCGTRAKDLQRIETFSHGLAKKVLADKGLIPADELKRWPFILEGRLFKGEYTISERTKIPQYRLTIPNSNHIFFREHGTWTYDLNLRNDELKKQFPEIKDGTPIRVYADFVRFGPDGRYPEDTVILTHAFRILGEDVVPKVETKKSEIKLEVLPPPKEEAELPYPVDSVAKGFRFKDGQLSTHAEPNWSAFYPEYVDTWEACRRFYGTTYGGEKIVQVTWDPRTEKCKLYTEFQSTEEALKERRPREESLPSYTPRPRRRRG